MKLTNFYFWGYLSVCMLTISACAVIPKSTPVYDGISQQNTGNSLEANNKEFAELLKRTFITNPEVQFASYPKEVTLAENEFSVSYKNKKIKISIADIDEVTVLDWSKNNNVVSTGHQRYSVKLLKTIFSWQDLQQAQKFADAVASFKQKIVTDKAKESIENFEPVAAEYRALKVKPPVSEEQRKYIVQANSLTQQKRYADAIGLYDKAIDLDQTNPIIYYNQALLFAQIGRFDTAINRMKKYLLLSPDAPDARGAQDKIYEWEIMRQK